MKAAPKPNPRIIGLVLIMLFAISSVVVLTDKLSKRDRHPATSPATFPATAPSTIPATIP